MTNPLGGALQTLIDISDALPKKALSAPVRYLEDFRETVPLAACFGQSGHKVPKSSAGINSQIRELDDLLAFGRQVADRLTDELLEIARQLYLEMKNSLPQLLSLEPAVHGHAHQNIDQAARVSQARVRALTQDTEAQLAPATARLEEIADHPCESVAETGRDTSTRALHTEPASVSLHTDNATSYTAPAETSSVQGQRAVMAARSQIGVPYQWGGTSPNGFDCSGLTQWSYRQAGVEIPRVASAQAIGKKVSAEELQPGDLVVWEGHVAMYSGNGKIIEAGDPVQENPLRTNNMGMAFLGFYRPTA